LGEAPVQRADGDALPSETDVNRKRRFRFRLESLDTPTGDLDSKSMNRAWLVTLLALAVVLIALVATWLTIPSGPVERKNLTSGKWETSRLDYPARLFRTGIVKKDRNCNGRPVLLPGGEIGRSCESQTVYQVVDLHTVRERVVVVYAGLAVVVPLIGVAFGALRRP
jgi:hypothetical protein